MEKIFKRCSKCLRLMTEVDWKKLPLCQARNGNHGYQPQFTEEGDVHPTLRLELRNCNCGSTLSVEVPRV